MRAGNHWAAMIGGQVQGCGESTGLEAAVCLADRRQKNESLVVGVAKARKEGGGAQTAAYAPHIKCGIWRAGRDTFSKQYTTYGSYGFEVLKF